MKVENYYPFINFLWLFHDGCPYHIETSSIICSANQWTGLHLIETSIMKQSNFGQIQLMDLEVFVTDLKHLLEHLYE